MKPPKLKLRSNDPLQDYYIDRDENYYSVAKLLDDTKHLPVFDAPIASLNLASHIWNGCDMFELAAHVKRCIDADLKHPILLSWDGGIADGRHRVIKAIIDGKATIKARRMTWRPTPDRATE